MSGIMKKNKSSEGPPRAKASSGDQARSKVSSYRNNFTSSKNNNQPKHILLVDDEQEALDALQGLMKTFGYKAEVATSGELALSRINPNIDAVLLDVNMPGLDGYNVAQRIRSQPAIKHIPIIMVTAMGSKIDRLKAVKAGANDFVQKPVDMIELKVRLDSILTIKESQDEIKYQRDELKKSHEAQKEILEKTLRGIVKVLLDILGLVNPTAYSKSGRIRRYVKQICLKLELTNVWQYEFAGMLSQIGLLTLPSEVLDKYFFGQPLSIEEQKMIAAHPSITHNLLDNIPRLEGVREMIANQNNTFDKIHTSTPLNNRSAVTVGAQILKTVIAYDLLVMQGIPHRDAVTQLRKSVGQHDPLILSSLKDMHLDKYGKPVEFRSQKIKLEQLKEGLILGEDLMTRDLRGILLARRGQEISPPLLERLNNCMTEEERAREIKVLIPLNEIHSQD